MHRIYFTTYAIFFLKKYHHKYIILWLNTHLYKVKFQNFNVILFIHVFISLLIQSLMIHALEWLQRTRPISILRGSVYLTGRLADKWIIVILVKKLAHFCGEKRETNSIGKKDYIADYLGFSPPTLFVRLTTFIYIFLNHIPFLT